MRKIIILLLMPVLAFSQIEKGRKMIGGSMSFYNDKLQRTFSFQPQFGYFLSPRFVVGTGVILQTSKIKFAITPTNLTTLSFTPFMRYYVATKKVNPFIQFGGIFATTLTKTDKTFPNRTALNLGVGNTLFLNKNVALDFTVSYNYWLKGTLNNGINSGIGLQIFW